MRPVHAAVVACLAISVAACGESNSAETAHVGEGDSGRTVLLVVGQGLLVTLSSNPSTGYSWSCGSTPEAVLSSGTSEYVATRPVLPGSGGYDRIRFYATGPGRTLLECEYRRGLAEPAAKTVTYSIIVE